MKIPTKSRYTITPVQSSPPKWLLSVSNQLSSTPLDSRPISHPLHPEEALHVGLPSPQCHAPPLTGKPQRGGGGPVFFVEIFASEERRQENGSGLKWGKGGALGKWNFNSPDVRNVRNPFPIFSANGSAVRYSRSVTRAMRSIAKLLALEMSGQDIVGIHFRPDEWKRTFDVLRCQNHSNPGPDSPPRGLHSSIQHRHRSFCSPIVQSNTVTDPFVAA